MKTIRIEKGRYQLGWRHLLSKAAQEGVESFLPPDVYYQAFSPSRVVELHGFEMQTEPIAVEALLDSIDEEVPGEAHQLAVLCNLLDDALAVSGWRLPTEDEFEAAVGGALFAWGNTLPQGSPYQPGDFQLHQAPTQRGLILPHNSYQVELVRAALKMGDGGAAVCGP